MPASIPAAHIRLQRAYDGPTPEDGARILVDRLWPRGLKKEALALAGWAKELAPSTALRQWFHHESGRWPEFQQRYRAELAARPEAVQALRAQAQAGTVTLIYSAHSAEMNNAVVLRDFLLKGATDHETTP
ncbi:DUF488 family protein [Acidovorax sp. HDW3]|uniref:DUF488 domain-containing protein n=1 Tax=Acidovorax sp. HDW3 TaxID=2714923 RepID=UPI00140D998E|nr:DUF488 family protein [Acidovorax sp. HDW3]QIL43827.1 DUF488 family protein [Acidovorax sp. HDW3]